MPPCRRSLIKTITAYLKKLFWSGVKFSNWKYKNGIQGQSFSTTVISDKSLSLHHTRQIVECKILIE